MFKNDMVDYLFELSNGEQVFVEMEDGSKTIEVRDYLESQLDSDIKVVKFLGIYSVDEAEMIGYDTY